MAAEAKTHDCQDIRWLEFPEPDPLRDDTQPIGLRFPGLSRECEDSRHLYKKVVCACYGNRGRVPVDTLEAWLDAWFEVNPHLGWFLVPQKKEHRLYEVQSMLCGATGNHPARGE